MSGNPVDDYLNKLRGISEQAGQQKIRTLAVQFNDTLSQLPALKAEVDFMLSGGLGVDYDVLAKQLEAALEKATSIMLDISMLPAHIFDAGSIREFIERLRTMLKIRTANHLAEKFSELCAQIERNIEAERKRQEEEAQAKAEAEERVRKEAEVKAKAEERALTDAEAKTQVELMEKARKEGFVLIKAGKYRYSVTKEIVSVIDLYFSCYPVTNKQYRLFINYLHGKTPMLEERFSYSHFEEVLGWVASSGLWDSQNANFEIYINQLQRDYQCRFSSSFDDDSNFNCEEQPVVGVSWYDAKVYCLWLSLVESCGNSREMYRLPTEQEWEWAASGGKRIYPWGNEEPIYGFANYGHHIGKTTLVGSYQKGATPEGLYDMAGNVREWQENLHGKNERWLSLRGGSWGSDAASLFCSALYDFNPGSKLINFGFRVVRPAHSVKI